jgi:hypothetical protein
LNNKLRNISQFIIQQFLKEVVSKCANRWSENPVNWAIYRYTRERKHISHYNAAFNIVQNFYYVHLLSSSKNPAESRTVYFLTEPYRPRYALRFAHSGNYEPFSVPFNDLLKENT